MTIQVRISREEIIDCPPIAVEAMIIHKLRKAGIPVKGVLIFTDVKHGTITRDVCYESCHIIYTWKTNKGAQNV